MTYWCGVRPVPKLEAPGERKHTEAERGRKFIPPELRVQMVIDVSHCPSQALAG